MTQDNTTQTSTLAVLPREERRALEHGVLRAIVEGDGFDISPQAQKDIAKLRELYQRKAKDDPSQQVVQLVDPVLMAFGTIIITALVAAAIKLFEDLRAPPKGIVMLYNPGPPIKVWTYDETDGLRWVAYMEKEIGTNEAVPLTARGENAIQIVVIGQPRVHTCKKNASYAFDGTVIVPRTE